MCSFCTGEQSNWQRQSRWSRFSEFDIDALVTQELHYLPPMESTLPVSPKHWMRNWWRYRFSWDRRGLI
jgi:hypothetical protein